MTDKQTPFFAKDINQPAPWEQPFQGSPSEVYNAFRQGQTGIPEDRYQALQSTIYHFSPAFDKWHPEHKNSFPMPNWPVDRYEQWSKDHPMSDLDTISKLLKAG